MGGKDRLKPLDIPEGKKWSEAPVHKNVYARFNARPVLQYDCKVPYRPERCVYTWIFTQRTKAMRQGRKRIPQKQLIPNSWLKEAN